MRKVIVAATQMACLDDIQQNIATAEKLVREAAAKGAQIVLLQELFEGPYFCQDELPEFLDLAQPMKDHPTLAHFSRLAKELSVVLPVHFLNSRMWLVSTLLRLLMLMAASLASIVKHTYPMALVIKKNFIFPQAIPVIGFGTQQLDELVWVYAGINGFLNQPVRWH